MRRVMPYALCVGHWYVGCPLTLRLLHPCSCSRAAGVFPRPSLTAPVPAAAPQSLGAARVPRIAAGTHASPRSPGMLRPTRGAGRHRRPARAAAVEPRVARPLRRSLPPGWLELAALVMAPLWHVSKRAADRPAAERCILHIEATSCVSPRCLLGTVFHRPTDVLHGSAGQESGGPSDVSSSLPRREYELRTKAPQLEDMAIGPAGFARPGF